MGAGWTLGRKSAASPSGRAWWDERERKVLPPPRTLHTGARHSHGHKTPALTRLGAPPAATQNGEDNAVGHSNTFSNHTTNFAHDYSASDGDQRAAMSNAP